MTLADETAQQLLRENGLRQTASRVAVLKALAAAERPLSLGELLDLLDGKGGDQATVFRTLVRFRELGMSRVVSQADRIDHYVLATGSEVTVHEHPHFECEECRGVSCLPAGAEVTVRASGKWAASVRAVTIHLRGECPNCLEQGAGEAK